ncbi:MAG TPA: SH3 domain-containing protein [Propionicimonas sp.]|nr:SH3 domain-containing protein [Propionicimonas sp.]
MYQPRRVADPIVTAEPVLPARGLDFSAPSAHHVAARRAVPSITDRLLSRSSITLAAVTVAATAGAVVLGSNGGAAVALGATTPEAATSPSLVPDAAAPATETVRTLTADQLAAPVAATTRSKKAPLALVSLSRLYTTGTLNVREAAKNSAKLLGSLDTGVRVSATSDVDGKYRKIEFAKGYGWVLESSLTDAVPVEAAGTTWAPCPRGSAVENKLRKDTVHIYRSVCALFPAVNSYGGWRAGGLPFHKNGRAVDIMLTPGAESALGHRIANYLIKHARDFHVDHIIFEQQIWTPSTPHWRHMADRGGITANHFNHVHVAIRA